MERYRKNIYCDWEFLKSLLSMQDITTLCIDDCKNEKEILRNVKNLLISSDIKLFLNIEEEQFDQFLEKIEQKRIKAYRKGKEPQLTDFEKNIIDLRLKQQNNELHLHFNESRIQLNDSLLQDSYLNAIFFTCESIDVCKKAMDDYGIIAICSDNINDFNYLTHDQGVAIRKHEINNWKNCLKMKKIVPCNSLIIIDNYILNDNNNIEENLTDIFDALIPRNLNKALCFQLSVFTTLCNDRGISYNSKMRLGKVKEILHLIRPNINFRVSIIKCSKDKFHDRTLITNNLYIGCGGGFDLFKKGESQKTTTVTMFNPFLNFHTKWSREAYSNILNDAKKIFYDTSVYNEDKMNDTFPSFAIGEKENRLFVQK